MRNRPFHRPIHIDMTPFVSVAYMLIVFFVWLKMIQQDRQMEVWAADNASIDVQSCFSSPYISLYLLGNNRIGFSIKSHRITQTRIYERPDSLRKALRENVFSEPPPVLIKPTSESTFKNLVDVLDELHIMKYPKYLLVDELYPAEQQVLKQLRSSSQ